MNDLFFGIEYLPIGGSWEAYGEAKPTRTEADRALATFLSYWENKYCSEAVRLVSIWKTELGWRVKEVLDYRELERD